ncbi:MAG TPA: S-adenosylmethionine:tRNA ribosyltransferase-isomerase [Prolixibacteraceae bacterium]|nr:S-adenosylmethionine:tRNA ribosyltransferase-isomerase [Prolixibacteraceae bacterium]
MMKLPKNISQLSIDHFDYELPDERIAKYPLEIRDQSKLLVWKNQAIIDDQFFNLAHYLPEKSLLIFNNTKVIRARLLFRKETGANIEIFILDPVEPVDYALNFQQTEHCQWNCVVGNLKKWKSGKLQLPVCTEKVNTILTAEKIHHSGNTCTIEFSWKENQITFSELLEAAGNIPIPPYLHRESEEVDKTRYQTVYSKIKGSVAAPTAGLHFTESTFKSLEEKGISVAELTLHVGAGTFQPVKSNQVESHEMHTEHFLVSKSFIKQILAHQESIIAVGTTSIRTLESLYWLGVKLSSNPELPIEELWVTQWEPYQSSTGITRNDAFQSLLNYLNRNKLEFFHSSTQIIIVPGYQFRVIDGMITNFHQPKSTLLLLISAFLGDAWKTLYQHALENGYRFLSYGDSNLYLK